MRNLAPMLALAVLATLTFALFTACSPLLAAGAALPSGASTSEPRTTPVLSSAPDPYPTVGAAVFNVTFSETGLPAGTLWQVGTVTPATGYVVANSSTDASVSQRWANGTYTFTASADLANYSSAQVNSTFTVNGSAVPVAAHFFRAYSLRFSETGIVNLTAWTVSVRGNGSSPSSTSTNSVIFLVVPAGPFNYSVEATGYNATPPNGTGNLSGSSAVSISFNPVLPPPGYITGAVFVGTARLYLNGLESVIQLGGGFFFTLQPGFYSIIVTATGYATNYTEVYLHSGQTIRLDFNLVGEVTPITPNVAVPGIDTTGWLIIGALSAVVVALGAATALYSRRARRPPSTTAWTHPPDPASSPPVPDPPAPPP
jgi:hypothetical protein